MQDMKKVARISNYALALLLLAILLYACAALVLGLLPVNRAFREPDQGIDIYLRANAVHADLMLPTHSAVHDWRNAIKVPGIDRADYLSIGWGDRAFYLETKNWADLRAVNALRALIGVDSTVMHISAENTPRETDEVRRIRISAAQLQQLVALVNASLTRDAQGQPQQISGAHYANNDGFFEAQGHYSMFNTCNEWVRTSLSGAGVRTASWSPLAAGINYQAKKIREH